MKKSPFGKTGLRVSPLGFGGAPVGFLEIDRQRVAQMLNTLLDLGVNVIDTAAMYRDSEAIIGQAIGHRRSEYVLVSKCGTRLEEVDAPEWSPRLIAASIDRSLARLKTDHVDVMLLHTCSAEVLKRGEAMAELAKARQAGKVRFAGYSGDNETVTLAAGLADVAVVETSVSIADQANIDGLLPAARERGLGVIAKRPIANAAWKPLSSQPGMYKQYAKTYTERFAAMGLTAQELGFAGAADWPRIALRFTLAQEGVHTAIIGTTNPENAKANLAAAAEGPLPAEAVAKIRHAYAAARKKSGAHWPAQG